MILDDEGNPHPAAAAGSGAMNGVANGLPPGVIAAVPDPIQYGGLQVGVQIPGFQQSFPREGERSIMAPDQNGMQQLTRFQPDEGNAVQH